MSDFNLVLPKMGESVFEATIITWHKKVGDTVVENDIILEVATDKVDSDVPSPVSGKIKAILFQENDTVEIGKTIAIIETEGSIQTNTPKPKIEDEKPKIETVVSKTPIVEEKTVAKPLVVEPKIQTIQTSIEQQDKKTNGRFSPLVLNIAQQENISIEELQQIKGTGIEDRVTKDDVLQYLENRKNKKIQPNTVAEPENKEPSAFLPQEDEIVEMDRMRKLIAKNMIQSKQTSAHVTSIVECDVTKIVLWREKYKADFIKKYGFNLTFLPVFVEAIARAIKEFPSINVSVDAENIIYKKNINIGIATALPNGNLIVPVIKNADRLNRLGLAQAINTLANKARTNTLNSDDISGGTYSVTNIGTFGNIIGTPIIPQPQVAIMAIGTVTKKPAVITVNGEDVIAIRHKMYLSHTYDHRVVDGMLGGQFVKRVATILESFNEEPI